jgi:hypothetical protein
MSNESIIKNRYLMDEEDEEPAEYETQQREQSGSGLVNTRISDRENEVS